MDICRMDICRMEKKLNKEILSEISHIFVSSKTVMR